MEKIKLYNLLAHQVEALLENETDSIANSANLSALLYDNIDDINWCGFYFLRGTELVLGPFQGKVACVRIGLGRGVCGEAAVQRQTIVVDDVKAFKGHIACDSASASEIVVPLVKNDVLIGVLDIDSPNLKRFDVGDKEGIEKIVSIFLKKTNF